ncbi:hypothetical protein BAY32_07185 [Elizabethkingia ursingii]|uniref:6-phosphogluconate dehydrogenase NADP-binding domain-containing protein n=2 Tax=Elizabethkingia ursingii TaxID=1756150 RepID=A0AAJ3TPK5_9FLAO|nr:hypothetical protein BBD34_13430 [Elizabethkingia ursingii]OPB75479.1 hypothetical protein BAY32_07185 [Elizabethkingia ursingii]OPB93557.1 hypothetical protein BB021_01085 [Elizabethkingia ursingii]
MKKLAIIGYGWLGKRLADYFSDRYKIYTINRSSNSEIGSMHFNIDFDSHEILENNPDINLADAIIICLPFSQRTALEILTQRFNRVSQYIGDYRGNIFLTSSTGIYPQDQKNIDETTYTDSELSSNMVFIENLIKKSFPQINILRLGGLMGDNRQLKNYKITDPKQVVNHIHYHDICRVIETMINKNVSSGIFNIVAPQHPTKEEVISMQNNQVCKTISEIRQQRIISSEKSEKVLNFTYEKPDPRLF